MCNLTWISTNEEPVRFLSFTTNTMKSLFLVLFLLVSLQTSYAQDWREKDTLAYRKYAITKISPVPATPTLWLHQILDREEAEWKRRNPVRPWLWGNPSLGPKEGFEKKSDLYGTIYYPDAETSADIRSYIDLLRMQLDEYMRTPADSILKEKEILIASLEAMDSLIVNKPMIFQDIKKKYRGDISKYVEALYAKSIVTNVRTFKRFRRTPTTKRLIKDPGFRYSISAYLYERWIELQRQDKDW